MARRAEHHRQVHLFLGCVALSAAVLCAIARGATGGKLDVPEGTKLGKANWEIAKGMMPDEVLGFYERGEYENPIMHLDGKSGVVVDPRLDEVSKSNFGRFDVNDKGTVVDVKTAVRPKTITGRPFEIDAADPKAGAKVIWNWFYGLFWDGSFHTESPVSWVGQNGIERRMSIEVHFKYYDGQTPEQQALIGDNPMNLLSRTLGVVYHPVDLNGIVSLDWRFRDGDKRDDAWTYVPALRRVRMISPTNRSDGFLGSDISEDDGPYFDGKPEDFAFRLIGSAEILGHYDGPGLVEPGPIRRLKTGDRVSRLLISNGTGWRETFPDRQLIAAQDPSWKKKSSLAAWAPLQMALVPRPVWVVEAIPKDRYYLYGKMIMYFDKQSFRGYWKNKYDWKGAALHNWMVPGLLLWKVDGPPGYVRNGNGGNSAVAVNYKLRRATVTGMPVADVDYGVDIPDRIYDIDQVIRMGK
jgi:hypothetical protein